jgi:hypothetical protein
LNQTRSELNSHYSDTLLGANLQILVETASIVLLRAYYII